MDGKSRILIVSFLGRIQGASKEKHRKAGGHSLAVKGMIDGRILPLPA
jgi:hypothetical protein